MMIDIGLLLGGILIWILTAILVIFGIMAVYRYEQIAAEYEEQQRRRVDPWSIVPAHTRYLDEAQGELNQMMEVAYGVH